MKDIAWPMKDVAFTPDILDDLWRPDFPDAEVIRVEDAGHYIQEDAPEQVIRSCWRSSSAELRKRV